MVAAEQERTHTHTRVQRRDQIHIITKRAFQLFFLNLIPLQMCRASRAEARCKKKKRPQHFEIHVSSTSQHEHIWNNKKYFLFIQMGLFFSPPFRFALCGIMHFTVFPAMFMTADCNLSVKIQLQEGKKAVFGVRLFFFFIFFFPFYLPWFAPVYSDGGLGRGGSNACHYAVRGAAIETQLISVKCECHNKTNIIQRNGTAGTAYNAHVWPQPGASQTEMP